MTFQSAMKEAEEIVKAWMKDWYENMRYEKDPSMEALALRITEAMQSLQTKLGIAVKSLETVANANYLDDETYKIAKEALSKIKGGE